MGYWYIIDHTYSNKKIIFYHRCNSFCTKNAKLFVNHFFQDPARSVVAKTSQRRRENILNLASKTIATKSRRSFLKISSRRLPGNVFKTSFRRRPEDVFQETSSRPLPGNILKISLRRLKTSSRLSLVSTKDQLEAIYEHSIYVRFKLLLLPLH